MRLKPLPSKIVGRSTEASLGRTDCPGDVTRGLVGQRGFGGNDNLSRRIRNFFEKFTRVCGLRM